MGLCDPNQTDEISIIHFCQDEKSQNYRLSFYTVSGIHCSIF